MKISRSILVFFFSIAVISCTKDETQEPKPDTDEQSMPDPKPEEPTEPKDEIYFSYYDDPNEIYADWTDSWIIIHNQDGELLDYKSFKVGDSIDFAGSAEKLKTTNTLSITTFNYRPGNAGGNFHSLGTVTEIGIGTIWDWSDEYGESSIPNPPLGSQFGTLITVNNVPNVQRSQISSQRDSYLGGSPFYKETNILELGGISFQRDLDYLLSIRDGNDEVRYTWFEFTDPVLNITLDYNGFSEYDQLLEVNLPEHQKYNSVVDANNKSQNYVSSFNISSESSANQIRSTAKLGYLDRFDTFRTHFFVDYNEYVQYRFYKDGERPTSINVPLDPQFQTEHTNIYDFKFTTNVEYYQNYSSWAYQDIEQDNITNFGITGKSEVALLIGALPDEILVKYPHLNLDNLKYKATSLYIGENIDFKSDHRTTFGGFRTVKGFESLRFKNSEE